MTVKLTRVTITGADESIDVYDLCRLHDEFPFAEWGILMSSAREGKDRYPSRRWLDHLMRRTTGLLPLAAHLCGAFSRDAIDGPFLWAVERPELFARFQRLQFNGAEYSAATQKRACLYAEHFPHKEFILQVKTFDGGHAVGPHSPSLLLDRSGGRGVELAEFPRAVPGVRCGYSGGFGPDNLDRVLATLTALPGDGGFWVDMETNVRTAREGGRDAFDFDKVRQCLEIAAPFAAR
jgi:hypothetical protein